MSMRNTLIFFTLLALGAGMAAAGLFKNSVDLADLAQVPVESLGTLKDSEFEVFMAQVGLNAAKAGERRAAGGVKAAGRTVEAEQLDLKAAKAEAKAAEANNDQERLTAANARITGAEEDLKTAKQLLKWKEQEQQARELEVQAAKSALDVAEAKRDAARVRLLHEHRAAAADKYDLADLERSVRKRQAEYDSSNRKYLEKSAKVEQFKSEFERLAQNRGLLLEAATE